MRLSIYCIVLIGPFMIVPVSMAQDKVHGIHGLTQPVFVDKTGSGQVYIDCGVLDSGLSLRDCNPTNISGNIEKGKGHASTTKMKCSLRTGDRTSQFNFKGISSTLGGWTLGAYNQDGSLITSDIVKDMDSGVNFSTSITLKALYTTGQGIVIKPLVVSCELWNNQYLVESSRRFEMTFIPPASASFSSTTLHSNLSHRTKDYGAHTFKLDFSDTVWYESRKLTFSSNKNATGCNLDEMLGAISYIKSNGNPIDKEGTNLINGTKDLKSDNPSEIILHVWAKKTMAGQYNCNITITQTVL